MRGLRRQGYSDVKSSRTFLGRLRVTGDRGENRREVILNRQTGEVLRDVVVGRSGATSIFDWDNRNDGKRAEDKAGNNDRDRGGKTGDSGRDGGETSSEKSNDNDRDGGENSGDSGGDHDSNGGDSGGGDD